jgi:glycosyltransferase involved in cell wall biosynthesis
VVLAVVVLTYNEELNLPACLTSLEGLPHALMVVDSGSTDRTLSIAEGHGARTLAHPFVSHALQWRWALEQLDPNVDWVLGLDADQYLSTELKSELVRLFAGDDERLCRCSGFYLNRRQIFRGVWIRHGGYYPKYLLKLFRVKNVQVDERDLMDHHFYVSGVVDKLTGDLIEDNHNEGDIGFWISKHLRYAELHAREELARRDSTSGWLVRPALFGNPDERIVWLKRVWYRMPLYVRPFVYFVYRYFFRRGFLDGKQGFIFHFLQSFWYRLLVDIRLDDLRTQASSGTAAHG